MYETTKWSQKILPKVLGGLFFLTAQGRAESPAGMLIKIKEAASVQLGLKQRVDDAKRQLTRNVKNQLRRAEILKEATIAAGLIQIVRERGVKIRYEGIDYLVTPNEVKIIIYL